MTDDVIGDLGDHAEVVGDQDDRMPNWSLQSSEQLEDLRLVVTSSAVVGSSAMSSVGR